MTRVWTEDLLGAAGGEGRDELVTSLSLRARDAAVAGGKEDRCASRSELSVRIAQIPT